MKQAEIQVLAEKLMGWHLDDHPEKHGTEQWIDDYKYQQWFDANGDMVAWHNWNPYYNGDDWMPMFKQACERWIISCASVPVGDTAESHIVIATLKGEILATAMKLDFQTAVCDAIVAALNKEAGE